ncbi:MAG: hypothetical protein KJ936_11725, partial [Proteobacteria bacterium]|nr:hypothetical protein [Pseudomonadota bacterium]
VIAAYAKVRRIPLDSRALPAAFLRSRPIFKTFNTFYKVVNLVLHSRWRLCLAHRPWRAIPPGGCAGGRHIGEIFLRITALGAFSSR